MAKYEILKDWTSGTKVLTEHLKRLCEIGKSAKFGDWIECPVCGRKFRKHSQSPFCRSGCFDLHHTYMIKESPYDYYAIQRLAIKTFVENNGKIKQKYRG